MRWVAVVAVLGLAACGGSEAAAPATTSTLPATTTTVEDFTSYCAVMARTDIEYRSGDIFRQAPAEQERIAKAPLELYSDYAKFTDVEPGVPADVVARLQDWTFEHCGFVPTFSMSGG